MNDIREPTELEAAIAAEPEGTFNYEATFVPYSKVSAERKKTWSGDGKKPTLFLSWRVKINGEEFDYSAGIGHISDPDVRRAAMKMSRTIFEQDAVEQWVEGRRSTKSSAGLRAANQEPPKLADVLSGLLLDSSALDESFEDWASNYGYDADSRNAEKTYNECRDNSYRLLRAITPEVFNRLRGKEQP